MLQLFSLASLVAFSVVGGVVGWRIRKLARATGGAPERWVGVCLLAICAIAYPLLIVGQALPPGAARVAALSLGIAVADVGVAAIYLFTRSAFRPDVRWLGVVLAVPFAGMAAHWGVVTGMLWDAQGGSIADAGPFWSLFTSAVSGGGFAWTGVEALRYWALLRRRVALGLADPLVVHRMLLWGLVGVSSTTINLQNAFAIVRGIDTLSDPASMLTTAFLGSFNAVALWLAFLPPAAYARRVRGAAGAPGAAPTL
jgi:hypothetical protein